MSRFSVDGRTAVITGGTRGIGRGIAEILLEHGANVVVNGRSEEKGQQALKEMGGGDNVHFIAGDVMKKDDVEALVDGAHERYGSVDVLVNNAGGITGHGMIADLDDWAWLGTIEWNLNSAFWATRRALRYMVPQGWGRIINISSVEGKQANKPGVSNYITTKHALNGLTKATAFEYGPMGITCNAICPGAIETDIMKASGPDAAATAGLTYEQFLQSYADESMIKRLNMVDEVAAMALLLASEPGAGVTGALLNVDGGTAPW
jgi:3-hydroxybutyrate dehydrogenase/3-oxoacyl-[acyl-carrier protein] reductase